jgi:hypothetical protein
MNNIFIVTLRIKWMDYVIRWCRYFISHRLSLWACFDLCVIHWYSEPATATLTDAQGTWLNYLRGIEGPILQILIFLFFPSACSSGIWNLDHGILKGEVLLYRWPPVWLVWNQLYDNWQFLFLFAKQTNLNRSNRRSMVQWYFHL